MGAAGAAPRRASQDCRSTRALPMRAARAGSEIQRMRHYGQRSQGSVVHDDLEQPAVEFADPFHDRGVALSRVNKIGVLGGGEVFRLRADTDQAQTAASDQVREVVGRRHRHGRRCRCAKGDCRFWKRAPARRAHSAPRLGPPAGTSLAVRWAGGSTRGDLVDREQTRVPRRAADAITSVRVSAAPLSR
jgi:hypothetical protein